MYKEVIYFCAELLNYWSMTFWGLKLFSKVYDIHIHKKKWVENSIFLLSCMPIALHAAGNYKYTLFTNFLTHIIVIYMCILIMFFSKSKISLSMVAFYFYGMRLIDLWSVAVIKEISRVSRDVELDITHIGIDRTMFLSILAICYYGVYCFCRNKDFITYINENRFYCRGICLYTLLGNFCFSVVYYSDYREHLINYWIFYLVCAFIIIGTFLFYFVNIKGKERERLLNMRNDMMEANYHGLQKAYYNNRTLQHDHKNHLLAIHALIEEGKNNEAIDYINTYMNLARKSSTEIESGNSILDIIVNSKIEEAKDKCINFSYEIDYLGYIPIKDIDMCALMANLLDNSIEACEKNVNDAWIRLNINRRNDMLFIQLSNRVDSSTLEKKNFFQSEKQNLQLHGWGMRSIERVINKYGGSKEYQINKEKIEIFINIPL